MVAIRQGIIPWGNANRPATKLATTVPGWITVHETANTSQGADAEMHRVFVKNGGGASRVSFHFAVDDHEAIQLLPLDEIGWHAGDGCDDYPNGVIPDDLGCFASVSIETCVNSDGNWAKTLENLENLIAKIAAGDNSLNWGDGRYKGKLSVLRTAQHNQWSGKNCPSKIRATGIWGGILARSTAQYNLIVGAVPPIVPDPPLAAPFPAYDGTNKKTGNTIWYALQRKVTLGRNSSARQWADYDSPKVGKYLKKGSIFTSLYILENEDKQWFYCAKDGGRIIMNHCIDQFRPQKDTTSEV